MRAIKNDDDASPIELTVSDTTRQHDPFSLVSYIMQLLYFLDSFGKFYEHEINTRTEHKHDSSRHDTLPDVITKSPIFLVYEYIKKVGCLFELFINIHARRAGNTTTYLVARWMSILA